MKSWSDSPYINRFVSADTIVPGYANPQSLNRYSYVTNNPLRYTDPTEHMPDDGCSLGCTYTPPPSTPTNYCTTHPGSCGGGGGGGSLPSTVILDLPCGGMITCNQQTPYEYVTSLLPFTTSDTCYFLLHDPVLCNSSSWQNFPNLSITLGPVNPPNFSINWSGVANFTQDLSTTVSGIGGGAELVFIGYGCVTAGPPGCVGGVVGANLVWVGTGLNGVETGLSTASMVSTLIADRQDDGRFGEATHTSVATWGAGLISTDPLLDVVIDGYASGYNHGVFCGIDTILGCLGSP